MKFFISYSLSSKSHAERFLYLRYDAETVPSSYSQDISGMTCVVGVLEFHWSGPLEIKVSCVCPVI